MNPAVIIPAFYTSPMKRRGAPSSLYDHPTPLNSKGTLERCLASLQKVRGLGQVIILVAVEGGVEKEAAAKVKAITDKFPQMHTLIIAQEEESIIQQRFEQLGFGNQSDCIGLTGYSAIRNLGLVVAQILGFDSVVFLDDDEVVEDEEFLEKAMYGLGKLTKKGIPILAKSGFYSKKGFSDFLHAQHRQQVSCLNCRDDGYCSRFCLRYEKR